MAFRFRVVPEARVVSQLLPFQRRMSPPEPTTKPSAAVIIKTSSQVWLPASTKSDQAVPFHLTIWPLPPTAKQLLADEQWMAFRFWVVPEARAVSQLLPFQRRIWPTPPTAKPSVGERSQRSFQGWTSVSTKRDQATGNSFNFTSPIVVTSTFPSSLS